MRRVVAVLCLAILTGACSSASPGAGGTTPAAPSPAATPSPEPEVSLPPDVRPFPLHLASQEGARYAATGFDPVFTYVGVGGMPFPFWGNVNEPGLVILGSDESAVLFLRPDAAFDATGEAGALPDDLVGWFADLPQVRADAPGEARLAGLTGTMVDARVERPVDGRPAFCEVDCLPLVRSGGEPVWVEEGRRLRLLSFDLSSGPLVVLVDSTPTSFAFLTGKVEELLASVEFLTPQS